MPLLKRFLIWKAKASDEAFGGGTKAAAPPTRGVRETIDLLSATEHPSTATSPKDFSHVVRLKYSMFKGETDARKASSPVALLPPTE